MDLIRKRSRLELLNEIYNERLKNLLLNEVNVLYNNSMLKLYNKKTTEHTQYQNDKRTHENYIIQNKLELSAIKSLIEKEEKDQPAAPEYPY